MSSLKININKRKSISLMEFIIYYYLFITLFSTIINQVQMMIFGEIVVNTSVLGAIVLLGLYIQFFYIIFSKGRVNKKYYFLILFILYSFFMVVYYALNGVTLYLISNFIYTKLLPIFFVVVILFSNSKIDYKSLLKKFEFFALCNALFMFVQYITDDLIWPFYQDSDGNNLFWSIRDSHFTRIRPPGLMPSALTAGYISLIWMCIILFQLLSASSVKKGFLKTQIFKLILAILSILCTQTRNIYMAAIYIVLYFIIAILVKRKDIILPIFNIVSVVAYMLLFILVLPLMEDSSGIMSNGSSLVRYYNWMNVINVIKNENLVQVLFGITSWQAVASDSLFSDNLYFDQLFSMGLIGLIFYLVINFKMQSMLVKCKSTIPVSALVASILFIGVANVPNASYESVIFIIASVMINSIRNSHIGYDFNFNI